MAHRCGAVTARVIVAGTPGGSPRAQCKKHAGHGGEHDYDSLPDPTEVETAAWALVDLLGPDQAGAAAALLHDRGLLDGPDDDARGPVEMPEHLHHEPCRACGHLCSHCPHPCPPTPGEVRGPEAHPERDPDVLHLELDALREELQRLRQRPTVEDLARRLHDHDLDPARTGEWGDLVAAWQERYRTLARAALEAMP